jgi:multidrug efflux pump subunit AcrB
MRFFVSHPTAANLLMLFLLAAGLASLPTLERETFPEFAPQELRISVAYPGAAPEDVERTICQSLEDAIEGVDDVGEITCQALENTAVATVKMAEGGSFAQFMDDIKSDVEAIDNFPEQAETPVIKQLGRTDHVVSIAVAGPMPVTDLKAYAEQLKDRLQRIPRVSQVSLRGFSARQLQVRVTADVLQRHGISIGEIAATLAGQNIDLPAGVLETPEQHYLIRFMNQHRTAQELSQIVILGSRKGSGEILLGDIAAVEDSFELDEEKVLMNGHRAALLEIYKNKSEDTLRVFDAVKAFVEQEQQAAPPNVKLTLTQNNASVVGARLQILVSNGLQGLLLVFIVMWLFFKFRFAFWVAMGLPVSFLGGLFIMSLLGQSINMITMVALLISLGLLMDDAIVISENIATHLKQKESALKAAIEGTRQVAPGVLSSFLTSVAVFAPLAFLSGNMGRVLQVIPVVLIAVLAVSLVEAFLILPHHLGHALKKEAHGSRTGFRQRFDHGIDWFCSEVVGRMVDAAIGWRYLFLGLVIAIFLASAGMMAGGHLKRVAFPDIDGDSMEARLLMPQGTPLWRTEAVVNHIITALHGVNEHFTPMQAEQKPLIKDIMIQFNKNPDAGETGTHVATISADILTAEERVGRIDDFLKYWRDTTGMPPDILRLNFREPQAGVAGMAIEIRLQGDDLDELKQASLELQAWLQRYQGIMNLSDDMRPGKSELQLKMKEGSLAFGLTALTVATQLRDAFWGLTPQEVQSAGEFYEIRIMLEKGSRKHLNDLLDFRVVSGTGHQVPLSSIADVRMDRGYARINRIQGLRTVSVTADVDTEKGNANQILAATNQQFLPALKKKFPGIRIEIEGQAAESNKTGFSMVRGFIIGLVGIFILLSFQFRSYIEPAAVMVTIPLAMIGVIWGHVVMGLDISMPSIMGAASLAGIVVNDSILLVAFLKLRVRQGYSVADAAKAASRDRFRAILLTSLTTIAGLTPLLMEKSLQAQILTPLATSIVFGLLASTLLVLLVVPAIFCVFDDFNWLAVEKAQPDSSKQE